MRKTFHVLGMPRPDRHFAPNDIFSPHHFLDGLTDLTNWFNARSAGNLMNGHFGVFINLSAGTVVCVSE